MAWFWVSLTWAGKQGNNTPRGRGEKYWYLIVSNFNLQTEREREREREREGVWFVFCVLCLTGNVRMACWSIGEGVWD